MYGQGNYAPQFRQGPPAPPHQYQAQPPQYQQGLPPPPPPPFQQLPPPPPQHAHRVPSSTPLHLAPPGPPPIYQHGPPAPPPQQGGPPPPPPPQSYMHLPNYMTATAAPPNNQQHVQYPSSMPPPRVLPPPPTQGPLLYNPFHLQPPSIGQSIQHGRPMPPPPPASFVPVTPAPLASNAYDPFEVAQPPSMPPPPPPPPPSSPPPLPPSPPPPLPTSSPDIAAASSSPVSLDVAPHVSSQLESDTSINNVSHSIEKNILSQDENVGPSQTAAVDLLGTGEYNLEGGIQRDTSEVDTTLSFEGQASTAPTLPEPKPAERGFDRGMNSSFSPKNHIYEDADSDMDMEVETKHSDGDQCEFSKEPVSMLEESTDVKEQQVEAPFLTDDHETAREVSLEISCQQLAVMAEDKQAVGSAGTSECTIEHDTGITGSLIVDGSRPGVSSLAASVSSKEDHDLLIKAGSPFRLIQDYSSDDSSEADDGPSFENVSPVRTLPSTVSNLDLAKDAGTTLVVDMSCENPSVVETELTSLMESSLVCPTSVPDGSPKRLKEVAVLASVPSVTATETDAPKNDDLKHQMNNSLSSLDSLHGDVDIDTHSRKLNKEVKHDPAAPRVDEFGSLKLNKEVKQDSAAPRVDEFGRLIRVGGSDSDSDGQRDTGRRAWRGRSRSPHDRWRKRSRSPWRRKDKWNRSPSWSPKKRRSRSKSPPAFRYTGDYGGEKTRRDRDQIPDCFDFLKGRCYRGASCRYMHHGSATGDMDRRCRGRQHSEDSKDSRNSTMLGGSRSSVERRDITNVAEKLSHESDTCSEKGVNGVDISSEDLPVISSDVSKDVVMDESNDLDPALMNGAPVDSVEVGQLPARPVTVVGEPESEAAGAQVLENQYIQEAEEKVANLQDYGISEQTDKSLPADSQPKISSESQHISGVMSPGEPSLVEKSAIESSQLEVLPGQPSEPNISVPLAQPVAQTPPVQSTSTMSHGELTSSNGFPTTILSSDPSSNSTYVSQTGLIQQDTDHPSLSEGITTQPPNTSTGSLQFQLSELPLPPPPPPNVVNSQISKPPADYNLQSIASNVLSQPAPLEAPSTNSWASLPLPPPPPPAYPYGLPSTSMMHTPAFRPLQFQPNTMPSIRPYPHGDSTHSQTFEFRPQTEELHRPPFHSEVGAKPMYMGNMQSQPFGVPNYARDERFTRPAMPDGNQFHSGTSHDFHMHLRPQIREEHHLPLQPPSNGQNFQPILNQRFASQFPGPAATSSFAQDNVHSFPDGLLPRSFSREDYGNPSRAGVPFTQQATFGLQWTGVTPRNIDSSTTRYPSSFFDSSRQEGPKVSAHYNPFASTFDEPIGSSRFSSGFRQEIESKHGSRYDPFSLSQSSLGEQSVGGFGLRQMTALLDSNRPIGQILPVLSNSLRVSSAATNDPTQSHEPFPEGAPRKSQLVSGPAGGDQYDPLFDSIEPSSKTTRKYEHVDGDTIADGVTKSSSQGPINAEENQKQSAFAAVATSPENDEFGETAIDAELGAEESGSPDNPIETANTTGGDVEIDQVQSKGKSKKSKDSRSMKLFKVALANFVKELLKPSWRQGNMSKEAFKTIVKKTVDKVSGAMKNHQIPKSQAKIDQYVQSSQRKLTNLVKGYVDKYVKL